MLAELMGPDCQGEIGLLLYNTGKEVHIWNVRHLSGPALPCPMIMSMKKVYNNPT